MGNPSPKFSRNPHNKYDCPHPECDRKGERGFAGPQGVGSHLRIAHGVAGSAPSTVAARKAKARASALRIGTAPAHSQCPACPLNVPPILVALMHDLLAMDPNEVERVFATVMEVVRRRVA
jgi:hypothetical protein